MINFEEIRKEIAEKWSDYLYFKKKNKYSEDHWEEAILCLVPGVLDLETEDIDAMMSMYMDVLTGHSDRCDQVINKFKVKEDNNDVTR